MKNNNDLLELRYVPLSSLLLWDRNPKKHDYSALVSSIVRFGFRDPMAFDQTLNEGKGGIVEGNGRTNALKDMFAASQPRPRGIKEAEDGTWLVPVIFGVDAKSKAMAEAYAIDHNSITMLGGDFDLYDISKLYEQESYTALLRDLQIERELPVSMDDDDLSAYVSTIERQASKTVLPATKVAPPSKEIVCPHCGQAFIKE